ncbi:MAG: hypothetical protein PHW20_01630, partial [Clostridia bacterium]|nr:hypothetical protein [Clostridia bacterium]
CNSIVYSSENNEEREYKCMNILICDVVTPVILYPIIYWPFVLAGLVLIVIGILLFRFLKRKNMQNKTEEKK